MPASEKSSRTLTMRFSSWRSSIVASTGELGLAETAGLALWATMQIEQEAVSVCVG